MSIQTNKTLEHYRSGASQVSTLQTKGGRIKAATTRNAYDLRLFVGTESGSTRCIAHMKGLTCDEQEEMSVFFISAMVGG